LNQAESRYSQVLITRPQAQAERLAGLLARVGIDSIVQPAQEFRPRSLDSSERQGLTALGPPLLVVFTSPRAVEFGLPQLPPEMLGPARIAAIGPATARALAAAGKPAEIQPEDGYTSESLLEVLAGEAARNAENALVVCAPGGRELLVEKLNKLGWAARPLWVYERRAAEIRPEALVAIEGADRLLTVFTSADAMNSLSQRIRPSAWFAICRGEWLVISERLQRLARAFGPSRIHLAPGPHNADLATAIRSMRT
jgi:uroporphyrinogen-III synthase